MQAFANCESMNRLIAAGREDVVLLDVASQFVTEPMC